MKKRRNALLSFALSLLMCVPTTVSALTPGTQTTGSGTKEDPTVTITISSAPSEDGSTTTTQTKDTSWSDTDAEGLGSSYQSTRSETTVKDGGGNTISQSGYEQGRETSTGEKYPELTVSLEQGGQSTVTSGLEDSVTGRLKEDDPGQYDQTATTVDRQREVSVTLGEPTFTTGDGDIETGKEIGLKPVQPVYNEEERFITQARPDRFTVDDSQGPDGYDFRYTGWGKDSHYGSSHTVAGGSDEAAVPDEDDIMQFLLTDMSNPDAPDHTAYCVDVDTTAKEGWWYRLDNLETAGYYGAEAAGHIRAIVNTGYFGTAEGETGSLSRLVETLTAAQTDGTDTEGVLAGLDFSQMTEGEAQAATQIAIWMYGNRAGGKELTFKASNYNGSSNWQRHEGDEAAWARIEAAAAYLAGLSQGPETTTQVITEDKFIEDMYLTVKDKLDSGNEEDTGDSYSVDLHFTLLVTPGQNDSLNVHVIQDGNIIATTAVLPGQREYTIEDLPVAENSDVTFSLKMQGAQYLEQGVYIYTSEVKDSQSSQTFVGLAEGYRTVDVAVDMALRLDVQDAVVTTERTWRSEWEDSVAPDPGPGPRPGRPPRPHIGSLHQLELPRTGDSSALWPALAALAAAALLAAAARRRNDSPQVSGGTAAPR